MKFKIDENLPDELAELIRDGGWDCSSVVEQNLGGTDDPRLAEVCEAEKRILVTFDRGFLNIRTYPPAERPGIIVFRLKSQDKQHVLQVSRRLLETLRERDLQNELWIVHEDRIRRIRFVGSGEDST
jgi:predicted nuclease of predicted toxin-antitoxin system